MNYFVHTVAVSLPISKVRNSKTKLDDPFLWRGSIASRLEPVRGSSLLFTTKIPELSVTHFIDLGRMKD